MPSAADFEKLGVFYLGRPYDWQQKKAQDGLILYDSKDLVTHAVCVGMTGSGKTGLCLALIEEAAIDGIPAILIDPKGDLANLLLTFPGLRPEDFRPWVNEDDARRKNLSVDDYARQQAELWQKGLASWGEDGARIQRLRDAADFAIYTPGSNAGIPLSILKSFAAPPPAIREDEELLRERIGTTATSLLGLLGIDADPIKSREHILIADHPRHRVAPGAGARPGRPHPADPDAAGEARGRARPRRVLPVQGPLRARDGAQQPARRPGLRGLDGGRAARRRRNLLHTPEGKPRVAIVSIAHLNDAERMFFVSLLLNQVVGWMRTQSGTTSLRALLYMDEIFGFFPPVANPPSKTAAAHPAQAGARLRGGRGAGHPEPGGSRLQGPVQHRHLVHRAAADRARQGARARRPRGRGGQRGPGLRPRGARAHPLRALEPRLPDEQRARGSPGGVREPLGDVLPARAADARPDQDADGRAARRAGRPGRRPAIRRDDGHSSRGGVRRRPRPRASRRCRARAAAGAGQRPLLPPDVPQHFVPARGGAPAGCTLSTSRCSSDPPRCACPTPRTRST